MKTIETRGIFKAEYNSYLSQVSGWNHVYRFTGGKFGKHVITCNSRCHGDHGLFGRAASHWQGYTAATTGAR